MKTKTTQSKTGKSMLLTIYEGFSTYTITLPMPYAVRFFAEGLLGSLHMLSEIDELKTALSSKYGEKAHIQDVLRQSVKSYENYLKAQQEKWSMNERSKLLRMRLLHKYYKIAELRWFHPKIFHWAMNQLGMDWEDIDSAFQNNVVN